jgi:cytochrome c oxidase assembly factor CtaG
MYQAQIPLDKDPQRWDMAQKRTSFRSHLAIYLVVIGFLLVLWFITSTVSYERSGVPRPTWAMLGWGTGLVFHYLNAYGRRAGYSAVEKG